MGFLNVFPGRAEIIHRILVEAVDTVNDQIDEKQEQVDLAQMINNTVDIPFMTEDEEGKVFLSAVENLSKALEALEGLIRSKR